MELSPCRASSSTTRKTRKRVGGSGRTRDPSAAEGCGPSSERGTAGRTAGRRAVPTGRSVQATGPAVPDGGESSRGKLEHRDPSIKSRHCAILR